MQMHYRWDTKIHSECLKYLKKRQLWDLLGDDETLQCTTRNNPQFQELQRQKEVLFISNCKLAEQNLAYQPCLEYKKVLLAERYQLLSQLIASVRHRQKELDKLNGKLSLKATLKLLKEKLADLKDESESLGQKFVEGKMLLVDFVESFQSIQKFYHAHLVQLEKLQDVHMHANRNRRKEELLSSGQTSFSVMNTFYSISPSIILPSSRLPLIGHSVKPPYLPRLNHYAGADLWMPLMHKNIAGHSQSFENTWLESEGQLQYYKKD